MGAWVWSEAEPLDQRPARKKIGPVTLGWFSPAGDVFRQLGTPEKTELTSSVKTVGPDGPMPEMISGSLQSLAPEPAIMAHYRAACLKLGLDSPPSADVLRLQPELTCRGSYAGRTVEVIVFPKCGTDRCAIFVEVRGYMS